MRRGRDELDHLVEVRGLDDRLDLHLGHEVDGVLRAAEGLGLAARADIALDLAGRQAEHARAAERLLHFVELERLDDRRHEMGHEVGLLWFGSA